MTRRLGGRVIVALSQLGILFAQNPPAARKPRTGKEVFQAACVACHGPDGKGTPQTTSGFERPDTFPDFTDCKSTAREQNNDWRAIIHGGGRARGFSEIMPSFGEALTADQIDNVVEYLRGFCREPEWPRGELNLPRPIFTEKAFPEDEVVVSTTINTQGAPEMTNTLVYEKRFGSKNQIELQVPVTTLRQDTFRSCITGPGVVCGSEPTISSPRIKGPWAAGMGDLSLAYKRNLFTVLRTGSAVSLVGEVGFPTGDKTKGLSAGEVIFEASALYGQILPGNTLLQFQAGIGKPAAESASLQKEAFWRMAIGKTFASNQGRGRIWTPMTEFIGVRDWVDRQTTWSIVPQMQVALSKRQHIRASVGYLLPLNRRSFNSRQLVFYLLWDTFDGGLRDGW